MTLQGAIAELRGLIKADDVPFYYKGGISKVIETIQMDAVEVRHGEWTPCSERLPEPPCLIYDQNGIQLMQGMLTIKMKTGETMAFRRETFEAFLSEYKLEQLLNENNKVLAWMPLPEPYKEVQE